MRDKYCLECFRHDICDRCGDLIIKEFVKILKKADHLKYPNAYLKQQIKELEEERKK